MKKKAWEKPKLVVLVRTKPEEAILSLCKMPETFGGLAASVAPLTENYGCWWETECNACDLVAVS